MVCRSAGGAASACQFIVPYRIRPACLCDTSPEKLAWTFTLGNDLCWYTFSPPQWPTFSPPLTAGCSSYLPLSSASARASLIPFPSQYWQGSSLLFSVIWFSFLGDLGLRRAAFLPAFSGLLRWISDGFLDGFIQPLRVYRGNVQFLGVDVSSGINRYQIAGTFLFSIGLVPKGWYLF